MTIIFLVHLPNSMPDQFIDLSNNKFTGTVPMMECGSWTQVEGYLSSFKRFEGKNPIQLVFYRIILFYSGLRNVERQKDLMFVLPMLLRVASK